GAGLTRSTMCARWPWRRIIASQIAEQLTASATARRSSVTVTGSVLVVAREDEARVVPAEAERVGDRRLHPRRARLQDVVEPRLRVRVVQVQRRGERVTG